MESRMVKSLTQAGFFVEPSQVILDEHTGKSREIDIVAEYNQWAHEHKHICVKTHFVIEAINNLFPLVLTTERPSSPNVTEEYYFKYWVTPDESEFGEVDFLEGRWVEDQLLFAQYCSITKKKNGDLMASHGEDLYTSINKMVKYCAEMSQKPEWTDTEDKIWRAFFWQPVLVLQNDILACKENDDGEMELIDVSSALLEFNYYTNGEPDSIIIEVVREEALTEHLLSLAKRDHLVEKKLTEHRNSELT